MIVSPENIKYVKFRSAYSKLMAIYKQENKDFNPSLFTAYFLGAKRNRHISPAQLTYVKYFNHHNLGTSGKFFYDGKWIEFEWSCWYDFDNAHLTMKQKLLKWILRLKKERKEHLEKQEKEKLISNLIWLLSQKTKKIVYFIDIKQLEDSTSISKDREKEISNYFKKLINYRISGVSGERKLIPVYNPRR